MKSGYEHLPERKREELQRIVEIIRRGAEVEMVVLFGSHARGDWVEEVAEDGVHYLYQSDFDLLVLVETRKASVQDKLERDLADAIFAARVSRTPVSVLVHDLEFVNRRLQRSQYFFTDIKREGIVLFDSGRFRLAEPRELSPRERRKLAQEDFDHWFTRAEEFFDQFEYALGKGRLSTAAFLLHQSVERLYSAILLVFSRYKPNTHDIDEMRKLVGALEQRFITVFPQATDQERERFELLRRAYVDGRYKPTYAITREELGWLRGEVVQLTELTVTLCRERLESYAPGVRG